MDRIKTGIIGLDELIEGGIPRKHVILVSGQTGAGKTIFGLQFLANGARNYNEKGLFISFEQSKEDILSQTNDFGWNVKELDAIGKLRILTFKPAKEHMKNINEQIKNTINEFKPDRLVLDSISTYGVYAEIIRYLELAEFMNVQEKAIGLFSPPDVAMRKAIMELIETLKSTGVTSLIISELPETTNFLSRDTVSEFMTDGVILLNYVGVAGESGSMLQIRKMRGTSHTKEYIPYDITKDKGIVITPESGIKMTFK